MTSTLSPLTQAVTGALGSATANALAYPLDLVATRLQTTRSRRLRGLRGIFTVLHQTVTKRGIDGLYDGLAPDTASTIIANFLYFYAYSFFRKIALRDAIRAGGQPGRTPVLSVAQELALGFLAGISSRLVTAPLSIITVRTQMELEESDDAPDAKNESKPVAAVKSIYAEDGLLGFWKGIESTILLSFNPALTFAFLHLIRRLMQFRPKNSAKIVKVLPSGPIESFVTGASANAASVAILYPLILAKTRLQAIRKASLTLPGSTNSKANTKQPQRYRPTLISTLRDAYTGEDGYPGGLYQGLPAQLIKCVIGMGVTIMIKERTEAALVKAVRRWRN